MIYDFGKVSSTVEARSANARASHAEMLLGIDNLVRDTANAVIETQRYQSLVGVAARQLEGVRSIAALVIQRSDNGAGTQSDKVQADARVVASESTLAEIKGQFERWQSNLAYLTGLAGPLAVSDQVPAWLAGACDIMQPDWTQAPAVLRAQSRIEQARAQSKHARAQGLPTLSLEAGGSYDLMGRSDYQRHDDPAEFTVGLNLKGSLYDGGAAAAGRKAADHALASAEAAVRNSRNEIGSALMQAKAQVGSLQRMIAALDERDTMMQRTRNLYRQQYVELGTRSLLDLLNAEQELHQAGFDRVNAMHDLRRLNAECMYQSGRARELFRLNGSIPGMDLRL